MIMKKLGRVRKRRLLNVLKVAKDKHTTTEILFTQVKKQQVALPQAPYRRTAAARITVVHWRPASLQTAGA